MQANRNQLERGRLEEYIAVEFEGELKQNFDGMDKPDDPAPYYILSNGRLLTHAPKGNGHTITWGGYPVYELLERRHRDGKIRIIDAVKIPIRKKDFSTFLVDCSFEPLVIIPGKPKGIAIFPADLLEPGELFGYIDRKILRCISNQTGKKSKALEQIREIAETISTDTPADEPPAPDAASDAAETVEAEPGAGALAYPDGLKVIKEKNGGALDAVFLKEVLPNVQYIRGTETDRPERWGWTKTKMHRNRDFPWTVFEWEGIRYRVWKDEPKKRYAVKLEIQEQGTPKNRVFDFKKDG
jgi:hypothetical protein